MTPLQNFYTKIIHRPERVDREMACYEAIRRLGLDANKNYFQIASSGEKMPAPNIRKGNWGCAISKAETLKNAAKQNKGACILEDDIAVHPLASIILTEAIEYLPQDWQILYLGYVAIDDHHSMPKHSFKGKEKRINHAIIEIAYPNLNHAVIVKAPQLCEELANAITNIESYDYEKGRFASDYIIAQFCRYANIPMYGLANQIVKQYPSYSDCTQKWIEKTVNWENYIPQKKRAFDTYGQAYELKDAVEKENGDFMQMVHPPFQISIVNKKMEKLQLTWLETAKQENLEIEVNGIKKELKKNQKISLPRQTFINLKCQPEAELWRWKHLVIKKENL